MLIGPFGILALSVLLIVGAIGFLRLPAFFALMLGALFVGVMAAAGHPGPHRFVQAVSLMTSDFGAAAGKIGLTLALAAVIGCSLMESGAGDKIVRRLMAVVGEKHAALALLVGAFVLSGPVFTDMVMLLLLPIARAISFRTGRNLLVFVLATGAGAIITNGTVPPAPGPLMVAEAFRLNLGLVIAAGFVFGLIPGAAALAGAKAFDRRISVPLRPTPGVSLESLGASAGRPESSLPGFCLSAAPIAVPFLLIGAAAIAALPGVHARFHGPAATAVEFFGDKNIALALGAVIALATHARQARLGWRGIGPVLAGPLEMAGVVILIISAGGAYGEMVKRAGLGDAVRALAGGHAINFVLLGWGLCALLRVAQGSATVAMITAASIVQSIAGRAGFGVHPVYVLLAIGYGSKFLPWMNDAGFWLVTRVGGITVGEALRSWSILACLVSLVGLAEILIISVIWPHPWH